MATVQEIRPRTDRFAERDPQVYHPLDRLRGIIRRYVVLEGLLSAVLFVIVWFAAGLILDFALFKATGWDWAQDGARWIRGLALITAVALFIALLIFRIARRLTTEFSYPALALVLERRFPRVLGDRLITAVEMADVEAMGKFGYSQDMLRATINEARARVGTVPVNEVFNWRRLWLMGGLAIALILGTLVISYASYAIGARTASPVRFGWKFAHVSGIFFERNVALMNTPWPRLAHLELIGFPGDELTIGRDASAPQITARAYRWVIEDRTTHAGWRPLLWQDLTPEFVNASVPAICPKIEEATLNEVIVVTLRAEWEVGQIAYVQEISRDGPVPFGPVLKREFTGEMRDYYRSSGGEDIVVTSRINKGAVVVKDNDNEVFWIDENSATWVSRTGPLPEGKLIKREFTGEVRVHHHAPSVDSVENLAYESGEETPPEVASQREKIKREMGGDYDALQGVIKSLMAKADDPSMGRTLRRLDIPSQVGYRYSGRRTAGKATLTQQMNNEFTGEIAGLKEDVEFVVRGADFSTLPRKIRLIPPPSLRRIGREQAEPAYLHHSPPQDEGYMALKGLLQKVVARDLPLAGERTHFGVPAGTELTLFAEVFTADDGKISDNDRLVSAEAIPIKGRFPGTKLDEEGKPTQEPVPLQLIGDGEGFRIDFTNRQPDPMNPGAPTEFRLHESVEFKVTFTNKYNVSATRTIAIVVTQDQAPSVEVAVDVIRKLGNYYLVTPNARILFNPESFVKDDHGLSNLTYSFNYWAEDSDVVRSFRAGHATRSLMTIPMPGSAHTLFLPVGYADNFSFVDRGDTTEKGSAFVSEFFNQNRQIRRINRDDLMKQLGVPKAENSAPQTVKKIELRNQDRDFFDLKYLNDEAAIKIRVPQGEVQPIYRMDLFIEATDNNVDNDTGPRVVRNLEPIRLRIVSDADLLIEISKEEELLATRLDEALARIASAKRKYEYVRSSNGFSAETPEVVETVKVRSQDAMGDIDKARDIVQSVGREFRRLYIECQINRLSQATIDLYMKFADEPDEILREDSGRFQMTFPKALALLNNVQDTLNTSRWAPLAAVSDAENALYALERDLLELRRAHGDAQSIDRLRKAVLKIKDDQARIGADINTAKIELDERGRRKFPTFSGITSVSFAKGEAKKLQVKIQWNQYPSDDINVKFAVFDMENNPVADAITVPSEMELNFEKHNFRFDLDLKAGNKEGTYKVRITPAVGPPYEFQVIIK